MARRISFQTLGKIARQKRHIADYYSARESAEQSKTASDQKPEAESKSEKAD